MAVLRRGGGLEKKHWPFCVTKVGIDVPRPSPNVGSHNLTEDPACTDPELSVANWIVN